MSLESAAGSRSGGASSAVLELRLADAQHLFDTLDPAPFRERDLDPKAAAYIVEWAQEQPPGSPLALVVHLGSRDVGAAVPLDDAVHEYFRRRAVASRRRLRKLFRTGRISLAIGLAFLLVAIVVGEYVGGMFSKARYGRLVEESLVIGGWVALWHPMGIFLYEWWPIGAEARLYDRLSTMNVSVYSDGEVAPAVAAV
ncbi:MAG TPA: hypothetical protein PKV98_07525 [Burkholderiaceae bacterium]|nr:hypothetical protein [Burkholderiaceae bacterium]